MSNPENVENLLEKIAHARKHEAWDEVRLLSTRTLTLDPRNWSATKYLYLARRMLSEDGGLPKSTQNYPCVDNHNVSPERNDTAVSEQTDFIYTDSFVGRRREMSLLCQFLHDSESGDGRISMISGEPGIGKSRLTKELTAYARSRGIEVLWGRCHEDDGAPAYWPWIQALRANIEACDKEALASGLGNKAGVIASLVPEVKDKLPDAKAPLEDPAGAQFRLFDAVTTFIIASSIRGPFMVVLEDLHWADADTLKLLEFMAPEIGEAKVHITGTYRDTELNQQLRKALGSLTKEQHYQHIHLSGLLRDEAVTLITRIAGEKTPGGVIDAIYDRTDGNPLYTSESAKVLRQSQAKTPDQGASESEWRIRVPDGVMLTIEKRLERLGDECNALLTIAAVIGREFTSELVAAVSGDSSDRDVEIVLNDAVRAGIIEESESADGSYQFTHDLIREVLVEKLEAARMERIHLRLAQALECLTDESTFLSASAIYRHYKGAGRYTDKAKVAHYALLTGEEALSRCAFQEAFTVFSDGIGSRKNDPMDKQLARLYFGRAKSRCIRDETFLFGDIDTYEDFRLAYDYYDKCGDAAAAVAVAEAAKLTGSKDSRLYKRAIPLVDPESIKAVSLSLYDALITWGNPSKYEYAMSICRKALKVAIQQNNLSVELRSRLIMSVVEHYTYRRREALEQATKALELAEALNSPSDIVMALTVIRRMHFLLGESAEAKRADDRMVASGYASLDHLRLPVMVESNCYLGDWAEARRHAEKMLEMDFNYVDRSRAFVSRCCLRMAAEEGDTAETKKHLSIIVDTVKNLDPVTAISHIVDRMAAFIIPEVARITGEYTYLDIVDAAAQKVCGRANGITQLRSAKVCLGLISVLRNDRDGCNAWYKVLTSPDEACQTVREHRFIALLAHAVGKLDEAVERLERHIDFCDKAGYLSELAWSYCDCADVLLDRNFAGDNKRAREYLGKGQKIAEEIGMRPLASRITDRIDKTKRHESSSGRADGVSYPDGLTAREIDILRYVVKGYTNREIGELLHISARTVARHLQNIYPKTGSANRAEASAYAIQIGIVEH